MSDKKIIVPENQLSLISESIDSLKEFISRTVYQVIHKDIIYLYVLEENKLSFFNSNVDWIIEHLRKSRYDHKDNFSFPPNKIPYLKQALLFHRHKQANLIEEQKEKTLNSELSKKLDKLLIPIDVVLQSDWIREIKPASLPKLADFLSIESIDKFLSKTNKISKREYDEKFHILQSPKLFLKDLEHFRKVCEVRGCSIAVAYIDIDNFKTFNTNHTEVEIDRRVLPQFMQALEAFVYNHGFAYRYGGDE